MSDALSQIPNTFKTGYENAVRMGLQQQLAVIANETITPQSSGEGTDRLKLDDIVGNRKSQKGGSTRNADTQYGNTTHDRVWAFPPDEFDYFSELVDKFDQLKSGIDLTGNYTMAAVGTINRSWDDAWIAGFYGTMYTGKNGTVSTAFSGSNVVAVDTGAAAATRFNVEKVRKAEKILLQNFVDPMEPWYMGITAEQADDLWGQVMAVNGDYRDALKPRFSANGKQLLGLKGFEFVNVELSNPLYYNAATTLDGSGYRKTPFWARSGMRMVYWEKLFTSIDRLPGKHFSAQVYARTNVTATRTDNGKCGYVLNSEG